MPGAEGAQHRPPDGPTDGPQPAAAARDTHYLVKSGNRRLRGASRSPGVQHPSHVSVEDFGGKEEQAQSEPPGSQTINLDFQRPKSPLWPLPNMKPL